MNFYTELLEDLAKKLDFSSQVISESIEALSYVIDNIHIKNKEYEYYICSIFYYINKKNNSNISIQTISVRLKISRKNINKVYKSVETLLDSKFKSSLITNFNTSKSSETDSTHESSIAKPVFDIESNKSNIIGLSKHYCEKLELNEKVSYIADLLTKEILQKEILTGRTSTTIAAVGVFYAMHMFDYPRNPKEFIKITTSGYPTILNNFKIIEKNKDKFSVIKNFVKVSKKNKNDNETNNVKNKI